MTNHNRKTRIPRNNLELGWESNDTWKLLYAHYKQVWKYLMLQISVIDDLHWIELKDLFGYYN